MDTFEEQNLNFIKQIPKIPEAFRMISDLIKEQGDFADVLISNIENNEDLKNNIINLSNSKYFITGQKITTIRGVVLTLGIMKLKNIIMTLATKELMSLNENGFTELWEHSLRCAIACEILANEYNIISPQDAYALGFLHDIGKVILYKNNINKYYEFNNKTTDKEEDIISLENEYFNTNHTVEGTMILKKWEMPKILIDCIKYHHTPSLSTIPSASGIIYIADKIVKSERQEPVIENQMINRLGFYINDIKNFKLNVEVKANFILEAIKLAANSF